MRALWLVSQLWDIVPVNPRKNRASSAARGLRILLVFYQHPAWFISLQPIETCGLLLKHIWRSIHARKQCERNIISRNFFLKLHLHAAFFPQANFSPECRETKHSEFFEIFLVKVMSRKQWFLASGAFRYKLKTKLQVAMQKKKTSNLQSTAAEV